MKKLRVFCVILLSFFVVSCSGGAVDALNQNTTEISIEAGSNAEQLNVEGIMKELCSDDYLGRVAGTEENVKAGQFIKNYYEAIGLEPFNKDSYYQAFTMQGFGTRMLTGDVDNVIGVIKGKDSSKAVVLSAHFDHVEANGQKLPGAIDNASGVAVLLEAAKDLEAASKKNQFEHDIIIAAFNAEELGLYGANAFIESNKSKYDSWYNINVDCIGMNSGKGLAVRNKHNESAKLYADFIEVLDESNVKHEDIPYAYSNGQVVGTSDHELFQNRGSAALIIGQDGIGDVVHTPGDNLSIMDYKTTTDIKDAIVKFIVSTNGKIY